MGRKDNGDGSVFQVNENKWVAKIQIGVKPNGKPNVKEFSSKTEREVKRKLAEFKKIRGKFEPENTNYITVKEYFFNWLYNQKIRELKKLSFDRLESTVKNHIIPYIGGRQLIKVSDSELQDLLSNIKELNLSYSTMKKVYNALNACFKFAVLRNDIQRNPMQTVSMYRETSFKPKSMSVFTSEEIKHILTELDKRDSKGKPVYYYREVFILIFYTGIRLGEALGIKKEDVDLEKNTIHIHRNATVTKKRDKDNISKVIGYSKSVQDNTKTNSSDRIIDLNVNAQNAIIRLLEANPIGEFLIQNPNGNIVAPSNLTKAFYGVLDNIGFKRVGIHSLRHTYASLLFERGADPKTVSVLLGHSSIKTTYDIYIHVLSERQAKTVKLLDDI